MQSVCGRIVIINKGKIVADAKTDELDVLTGSRKLVAKITGKPQETVNLLSSIPGVTACEQLPERDGDAYAFLLESQNDVDIRKMLFTKVASNGRFLVGLEPVGANLEDVFITLTGAPSDTASGSQSTEGGKTE